MPKPLIHAQADAKKFGGNYNDYLKIHEWFDETKAWVADGRHRCFRHHAQGIFEAERIFGKIILNSDNKQISVRDIGESHILMDFGGRFIPTAQDYIENMEYLEWFNNGSGSPPSSHKKIEEKRKTKIIKMVD